MLAGGPTEELGPLWLALNVLQVSILYGLNCRCGLDCLCCMCSILMKVEDKRCLKGIVLLLNKHESLCNGCVRIQSNELRFISLQ